MNMQPFQTQNPLIAEALRAMASTTCLNPGQLRTSLLGLQGFLDRAAKGFTGTEMELMRLSNVSTEQFLSFFLDAADRFFFSDFRRTRIPAARQFVRVTQELLGTAPATVPMRTSIYVCENAFLILSRLRNIERRLAVIEGIYARMEPIYMADAERIRQVRGPLVLSPPREDPGRGTRMLSIAEQIALATVRMVRQEVETMLRLAQEAVQEIVPLVGVMQRPRPASVFMLPM